MTVLFCRRSCSIASALPIIWIAIVTTFLPSSSQNACYMCVVQIGELVSQLSDEVKTQNKAIPWRIIKDTRNFYVHAYGSIDIPSVWDALVNDIPALKTACEEILTHF